MAIHLLLIPLALVNPPAVEPPPIPPAKIASATPEPKRSVPLPADMISVEFIDRDTSLSVTRGDGLRIEFATAPPELVSVDQIGLIKQTDSFGSNATATSDPVARQVMVTLGENPSLKIGGVYSDSEIEPSLASSAIAIGRRAVDIDDERVRLVESRYRDEYVKRRRDISGKLTSDNSRRFYDIAPYLDGLATMYEATDDTQYIDFLIGHLDEMLAQGKDLTGDGYIDFFAQNLKRPNVQLYDWRGFKAMARLTRLIGEDPELLKRYREVYARYLPFIEKQLIEKWSATYTSSKMKYDHPFLPYERENLIHRVSHIGNILIDYQRLVDNDMGRAGVEIVARRMKNQIQDSEQVAGAVEWNVLYEDNGPILRDRAKLRGVSDVSHAAATVSMIVAEALGTNLVFNGQDLDALSNTLVKAIWNGDRAEPKLRDFVDGGVSSKKPYAYGEVSISDGWVALGVYRSDVQDFLLLLDKNKQTGLYDFQFGAHLARNFRYAHWY